MDVLDNSERDSEKRSEESSIGVVESVDHISEIMENINVKVPYYLKELLKYTRFDNVISLSEINDSDVVKMEEFARNELAILLKDTPDFKKIFGIFSTKPELFKILEGHKKILIFLRNESKALVNKAKIRQKTDLTNENNENKIKKRLNDKVDGRGSGKRKRENLRENNTLDNTSTGELDQKQINENTVENSIENTRNLNEHAILHIKNILNRNFDNFSKNLTESEAIELNATKSNIKVFVDLNNCNAKISCFKCNFKSTAYYIRNTGSGRKWVVSNFIKHIKTHYKKNEKALNLARNSPKANQNTQKSIPFYFSKCASLAETQVNDTSETSIDISEESSENLNVFPEDTTLIESEDCVVIQDNLESRDKDNSSTLESDHNTNQETNVNNDEALDINLSQDEAVMLSNICSTNEDLVLMLSDENSLENSDFGHGRNNKGAIVPATSNKRQTDGWNSRHQRRLRALEIYEESQTTLDNFIKNISSCIDSHKNLKDKFLDNWESYTKLSDSKNAHNELTVKPLMEHLLASTQRNTNLQSHAFKYSDPVKKVALYLYLVSGRMSYEFLYHNMKSALPSLTTIHRLLDKEFNIKEGDLRIQGLKKFLIQRGYPLKIFLSEDQTAIIRAGKYDSRSNQIVGIVPALSQETGFPKLNQYKANSAKDIEESFLKNQLSSNAYLFVAQPLVNEAPSFCISLFGSNNRFTFHDVLKRWEYIVKQCNAEGIVVEGFASDGDTRCLKSMKIKSQLPVQTENPYSPYFQVCYDIENPVVVQDTVHISTKLKTRLLNEKKSITLGKFIATADHLKILINDFPKDKHLLCSSHLNSIDKMNFDAIDKMCSKNVTNLLVKIPNSAGTRQFLIMTRYILDSFLSKELSFTMRICYIWYVVFFCRAWRQWLKENKISLDNFITLPTYTCIELNAHGLILLGEKCRTNEAFNSCLPWLYSSQPCEKMFRQTRSMTSTFSTVVNYTMLDMLRRINRIDQMNDISCDLNGVFNFPREASSRLGQASKNVQSSAFTQQELKDSLLKAKSDAQDDLIHLGIENLNYEDAFQHISINKSILEDLDNDEYPSEYNNDDSPDSPIEPETYDGNVPQENNSNSENSDTDFSEDCSLLSGMDSLDLKTVPLTSTSGSIPEYAVSVNIKNKQKIVRKSALCWFFTEKHGLSADRLTRVKSMGPFKKPTEKPVTVKKLEKYYAVYYYEAWYLGRIIEKVQEDTFKVKFLKENLGNYMWPKQDDTQLVKEKYIFFGPINLLGNEPFQVSPEVKDTINVMYKKLKRTAKL